MTLESKRIDFILFMSAAMCDNNLFENVTFFVIICITICYYDCLDEWPENLVVK